MDESDVVSRSGSGGLGSLTLLLFPGGADEANEGGAAEEENGGGEEEPRDRPAQEGTATTGGQAASLFVSAVSFITPLSFTENQLQIYYET